jgi:hypothetical protein
VVTKDNKEAWYEKVGMNEAEITKITKNKVHNFNLFKQSLVNDPKSHISLIKELNNNPTGKQILSIESEIAFPYQSEVHPEEEIGKRNPKLD